MEKSEYPPPITPNVFVIHTQSNIDATTTQSKVDPAYSIGSTDNNASAPPVEEIGIDNSAFSFTHVDLNDSPPPYPTLSEEQARDAILQFVSENCCYGKKSAREMIFHTMESSSGFHYTLQTYAEKRETKWKSVPFSSGRLSRCIDGPEPSMWEVSVSRPQDYQEGKCKHEIPNTSTVVTCSSCSGSGRTRCYSCHGNGQKRCWSCSGRGRDHNARSCTSCGGRGNQRCSSCCGTGRVNCSTCRGHGKMRRYKQLKCIWKNHVSDHVVENTPLPNKLIRKVNGVVALEENLPKVMPVRNFPDHAINEASEELVKKHQQNHIGDRIIRQRHSVRIVPVAQVHYEWRNKRDFLFVYGHENKVYAPKYPQKCCCGCAIL